MRFRKLPSAAVALRITVGPREHGDAVEVATLVPRLLRARGHIDNEEALMTERYLSPDEDRIGDVADDDEITAVDDDEDFDDDEDMDDEEDEDDLEEA
jgi:hypothetical protein